MRLSGKKIIVTGGSRGLGKEIAKTFLCEGASVAFCGRGHAAVESAYDELLPHAMPGGNLFRFVADVSIDDEVNAFVQFASAGLGGIDALVNNAGIHGAKSRVDSVGFNMGEWLSAMSVNMVGTLNMCRRALPYLKESGHGKIINLSGGGATSPMPGMSAYAASKAAVVRFTETLAAELEGSRIDVNAVAPGAMNTRLLADVLDNGKGQVPDGYYEKLLVQKEKGGAPLEKAAGLCVYLASEASDGVTGKLISAIWDNWGELHSDIQKFAPDVYTLRRIVPGDRRPI